MNTGLIPALIGSLLRSWRGAPYVQVTFVGAPHRPWYG